MFNLGRFIWGTATFGFNFIYGGLKKVAQVIGIIPSEIDKVSELFSSGSEILNEQIKLLTQQRDGIFEIVENLKSKDLIFSIFLQIPLAILYGVYAAINYVFKGMATMLFLGSDPEKFDIFSSGIIKNSIIISVSLFILFLILSSTKLFFNKDTEQTINYLKAIFSNSLQTFIFLFALPIMIIIFILWSKSIVSNITGTNNINIATWVHQEFLSDTSEAKLSGLVKDFEEGLSEDLPNGFFPFSFVFLNRESKSIEWAKLIFVFLISFPLLFVFTKLLLLIFKNEAKLCFLFFSSPFVALTYSFAKEDRVSLLKSELARLFIYKISFFLAMQFLNYFLDNYEDFGLLKENYWDHLTFTENYSHIPRGLQVFKNVVKMGDNFSLSKVINNPKHSYQYFVSKVAIIFAVVVSIAGLNKYLEIFFYPRQKYLFFFKKLYREKLTNFNQEKNISSSNFFNNLDKEFFLNESINNLRKNRFDSFRRNLPF